MSQNPAEGPPAESAAELRALRMAQELAALLELDFGHVEFSVSDGRVRALSLKRTLHVIRNGTDRVQEEIAVLVDRKVKAVDDADKGVDGAGNGA